MLPDSKAEDKKTLEALLTFRTGVPTDNHFIYSTWLNGLYFGNPVFKEMNEYRFKQSYQKVLELILSHSQIQIACLADDQDVILGYTVLESRKNNQILHWVFVKPVWRKLGIARKLLPSKIDSVTHLTKVGQALKPKAWEFDPFLI